MLFRLKPRRLNVLRCLTADVLFCGTVTAIVLLTPIGGRAQVKAGTLSEAIEEVRQSPFWAGKSAVPPGMDLPSALWSPMAFQAPIRTIHTAPNDSTFPHRRVFFTALGANGLTLLPTLYLALGAAYGQADTRANLMGAAAIALPVFGTAAGATFAGARFLPSMAGSALGFATAVTTFFATQDAPGVLWILLPVVHAGITTFVASYFH